MTKKKILVGVVVMLILSSAAVFLLFKNSKPQKNQIPTGVLNEFNSNKVDKSNYESANLAQFSISYPNSFTPSEHLLSGDEGVALILDSEELEKNNGSFIVEKYPIDTVTLNSLKEYFNKSKLSREDISLGQARIQAVYFTGEIPSLQGSIQQNVILVSYNGYVYKIQMSYVSEERKEQLDQEFKNISSTINFL